METYLYKVLTKTQREKPQDKVLTMGPFNEVFNKSLDRLREKNNTITHLYRGSNLDKDDLKIWEDMMEIKEVVCVPCHSSTSRKKHVSTEFMGKRTDTKEPVLFLFKFPKGIDEDSLSVDLKTFSVYPGEEEILIDPQQEFIVSNIEKDKHTIITLEKISYSICKIDGDYRKTLEKWRSLIIF